MPLASQIMPKRMGRDDCEASGRRTAFDAARDKALQLIREAPEKDIQSEDQRSEIDRILADADSIILADQGTAQVI